MLKCLSRIGAGSLVACIAFAPSYISPLSPSDSPAIFAAQVLACPGGSFRGHAALQADRGAASIVRQESERERLASALIRYAPLSEMLLGLGLGPGKRVIALGSVISRAVFGEPSLIIPWEVLILHLGAKVKIFQPNDGARLVWDTMSSQGDLEIAPEEKALFGADSEPRESADAAILMGVAGDPTRLHVERAELVRDVLDALRPGGFIFLGALTGTSDGQRIDAVLDWIRHNTRYVLTLISSDKHFKTLPLGDPWRAYRVEAVASLRPHALRFKQFVEGAS